MLEMMAGWRFVLTAGITCGPPAPESASPQGAKQQSPSSYAFITTPAALILCHSPVFPNCFAFIMLCQWCEEQAEVVDPIKTGMNGRRDKFMSTLTKHDPEACTLPITSSPIPSNMGKKFKFSLSLIIGKGVFGLPINLPALNFTLNHVFTVQVIPYHSRAMDQWAEVQPGEDEVCCLNLRFVPKWFCQQAIWGRGRRSKGIYTFRVPCSIYSTYH